MAATRWRAPPAGELLIVPLDEIVAIFHRGSGITHLVASPVPELLAALSGEWRTLADLDAMFDFVDGDNAALVARLEELAVAGLVETA